ncbi:Fanconi anemia group D2 protein [Ischnura elegans]|uniref:Fanconi anemia group D2 protein n=1 Tax=Ischnura elegans TaxID=197161 RepID=UPI001ED87A83|nr:Fanconi anemia group D2 protein [Ischnura elegans]
MYKRKFSGIRHRNTQSTSLSSNANVVKQSPVKKGAEREITTSAKENVHLVKESISNVEEDSLETRLLSQKKTKNKHQKPKTYFEEIIGKCGLLLHESDDTYVLGKDQAMFVKDLELELKKNMSYPSNIDEFFIGFEKYVSNSNDLKKALNQTKTSESCHTARSMQQDSLVRLLLLTPNLQARVAKFIIEKAAEYALSAVDDMGGDLDEAGWVRLILTQLRLLDFVVEGETLASQLIELLQAAPQSVQQEVIFFMPHIVSDDQHQDVAESLSKLLHEHLSLTPAILEVLSQLNIGSILRAKVCEEMLDVLRKAPVEFLPSIVAFVLSESELADLELVTARLRTVLDLTPMPPPPSRSVALSQKFSQSASTSKGVSGAKSTQSSYVILTLEAIGTRLKVGQRGQRLVDAWVTALDAVDSANAHKTLDLLIIIVLLDLGNGAHDRPKDKARHRKTETLLKAKVRKGLFTEELLEKTFMSQSAVLREYFRTVTLISSILLSSRETALLLFGAAWLRLSIIHLAEHLRPTALGELIMHTAIGRPDTANVVLKTLHSLAHEHYEKIAPHSILLLGLLDKVEDMDIEQVRDLMDVLCFLAFSKDDHRSGLRTDITILIRKHLSSTNIQLKRKGVITSIMAVKHMASVESECDMVVRGPSLPNTRASSGGSQASEESLVPGSKAANAVMFLELVLSTCGCYAEIIGLLYDQLSCMSMDADLDEKFMEWITKTMTYDFQDSFIDETSSNFESSVDLPLSVQFALDEDLVNPIALKLTPLVSQREERLGGPRISFGGRIVDEKVERPLEVMNPLLRLMRILRFRLEDGDLSSIDALLGCGVVLPKMLEQNGSDGVPVHEEFAAIGCMEQRTFLSSIIFAINWFIELVNAFTFQKDVLLKKKVMKRVMNIVELRGILSECLPQIPGYIPPASQYLCPTPVPSFASAGKDVKKGQKRKRKRANPGSKKSKKALPNSLAVGTQDPDDNESGGEERDEDAAGKDEEDLDENPKEGIGSKVHKSEQILSLMAPFFRELDVEVFILLREEFVIGQYTAESTRRRPSELGPPELKYLLEEYTLKLEHKLPSNPLIMSSKGNAGRMSPFGLLSGKKTSVFLNLDLHESKDIALSAVSLLPSICEKLERVSEYFQDAIDGCDGILDNPQMFLGHSPILARCFHLLFKDIEIILSWNGYAAMGSSGMRLLKDALSVTGGRLGAVRRPTQGTQSSMTAVQLAEESCSYFARFADWVVRLPAAVALVTLIHRATLLAESRLTQREELVKVCRTFLSREWIGIDGHPETGAGAAEHLGTIMTSFLWASCSEKKRDEWESTGSPLESLHRIIDEVALSAADLKSNADRLSAFPAITKTSFHVVFNALATWLELVVKEENIEPPARPTQTGNSQVRSTQMRATQSKFSQAVASQQAPTANIKLEWWEIVIKCIHSLVKISKIHDSRKNLSVLLKKSYSLVNLFLSNGMPVLDKAFSSHPQKVSSVLRELQTSTRYIQHLCCDCKVKKDVGLTAHVPVMKRVLDRLVFRVKEMLLKNNCAIAFWVGNLKNKNLRGEEIISQAVTRSPSLRENEESDVDNDMDADADEDVGGDEPLSDGSDQVAGPSSRKSKSKKKVVSDDDDEEDSDLPSDID